MPAVSAHATRHLTVAQARRVALAAQGFGRRPLDRAVGMRDVQRTITRLGQFQIDTINVVQRAHYLPLYSRLGPYDTGLLDRALHQPPRRLFEYWGHAASLIDVTLEPALRWRMQASAEEAWQGIVRLSVRYPELIQTVQSAVSDRGPIGAREIERLSVPTAVQRNRDSWGWNWSAVKTALEWLLWSGKVHSARRNRQFERQYDLPERVIPPEIWGLPTPDKPGAMRILVARAARALGVGSLRCLRDYFRTGAAATRQAVDELVASGELLPLQVGDRPEPWWLWHEATVPRRIEAAVLVCPFDSLIFERTRLESLFGFFYRIEIYLPEPRRQHGYYVYPFLLGDEFVARVDLKAHRNRGTLEVKAAWLESAAAGRQPEVAAALTQELTRMAGWLGLAAVEVSGRGDLAAPVARLLP